MSCAICRRSSCTQSFHSLAEQERYSEVISLYEKGPAFREMAKELKDKIDAMDIDEDI